MNGLMKMLAAKMSGAPTITKEDKIRTASRIGDGENRAENMARIDVFAAHAMTAIVSSPYLNAKYSGAEEIADAAYAVALDMERTANRVHLEGKRSQVLLAEPDGNKRKEMAQKWAEEDRKTIEADSAAPCLCGQPHDDGPLQPHG